MRLQDRLRGAESGQAQLHRLLHSAVYLTAASHLLRLVCVWRCRAVAVYRRAALARGLKVMSARGWQEGRRDVVHACRWWPTRSWANPACTGRGTTTRPASRTSSAARPAMPPRPPSCGTSARSWSASRTELSSLLDRSCLSAALQLDGFIRQQPHCTEGFACSTQSGASGARRLQQRSSVRIQHRVPC